jgi:DNA-binding transcriptional regulator YiaG
MKDLHSEKYLHVQPKDVCSKLVKQYRTDIGMTQAEFADFTGVALGTIASWEVGQNPSSPGRAHMATLMRHSKKIILARINLLEITERVKRGSDSE